MLRLGKGVRSGIAAAGDAPLPGGFELVIGEDNRGAGWNAVERTVVKPHPSPFTALRDFALDGTDHASPTNRPA